MHCSNKMHQARKKKTEHTQAQTKKALREQRAKKKNRRTQRHAFTIAAVILVFGNTAGSLLACLLIVYNPALLLVT